MADVKKNVIVHHSADQMFTLVDRIEDYPLFLPWCGGSKVLERNTNITKASILIKYSGVNQSFTTENTKDYPHRIDLKLIDGPFKVLQGYWTNKTSRAGTGQPPAICNIKKAFDALCLLYNTM